MVDIRTFNLWQELACVDDLPVAALPAVIEVLTTPVARHLNIDGHRERWRAAAFDKALPALLNRTDEPDLRARSSPPAIRGRSSSSFARDPGQ